MTQPPVSGHGPGEEPGHAAGLPDAAPGGVSAVPAGGRDPRLASFAQHGPGDRHPPGAWLGMILAELSGPGQRCPGATDDELTGLLGRWQALESWAAAAKLGVVREVVRRRARPGHEPKEPGGLPGAWDEGAGHEVAAALAMAIPTADNLIGLAVALGARLPGIAARLTDGTITQLKAKIIADELAVLDDAQAAQAEALILDGLAGKTPGQIGNLAATAAVEVDPAGAARRREQAEKDDARVRFWREAAGTSALAGYGLPTDAALAANANVNARAKEYKKARVDGTMDQLRVQAFLDILNGIPAHARIAQARAGQAQAGQPEAKTEPGQDPHPPGGGPGEDAPADGGPAGSTGPADGSDSGDDDFPGGDDTHGSSRCGDGNAPGDGRSATEDDDPAGHHGPVDHGGPADGDPADGGSGDGPGGHDGDSGPAAGQPGPAGPAGPALAATTNLTITLATLLGLADRPGHGHGLGPLDPALARHLAAAAARSPHSTWCITITGPDGTAIGHGCAKPARTRRGKHPPPRDRNGPWALTPRDNPGPPGGYGSWTLTLPDGRPLTVDFLPIPVTECDHRYETHGYQPTDTLRHLVQVRDGTCTFPCCSRHARESDFEHAVPYDKGGRTCACNAGARSRRCHKVKQSKGWTVTQPRPGWHQWTTPSGRTYTQGPKQYPT